MAAHDNPASSPGRIASTMAAIATYWDDKISEMIPAKHSGDKPEPNRIDDDQRSAWAICDDATGCCLAL